MANTSEQHGQLENFGNILAYLCEHGPSTRHAIHTLGGKVGSSRYLYPTMRELSKSGYVVDTGKNGRYRISQSGFILYLKIRVQLGDYGKAQETPLKTRETRVKTQFNFLRPTKRKTRLKTQVKFLNLTKTCPDLLPTIFKLWVSFDKQKVCDIAEKILVQMARWASNPLYQDSLVLPNLYQTKQFLSVIKKTSSSQLDGLADLIETKFFDLEHMAYAIGLTNEERTRWFDALSKDDVLAKPYVDWLKSMNEFDQQRIQTREMYIFMLTNDHKYEKLLAEAEKISWRTPTEKIIKEFYFEFITLGDSKISIAAFVSPTKPISFESVQVYHADDRIEKLQAMFRKIGESKEFSLDVRKVDGVIAHGTRFQTTAILTNISKKDASKITVGEICKVIKRNL